MFGKLLCSAALAATLAMPAWAESTTTTVHFAPRVTGTAATGQISGRDTADFAIAARAGQKLRIEMISDHPSSAFDIYAPGATPGQSPALFTGAGKSADITLPSDGTYLVRTYLAPGAENASARFSLTIDLGGSGNGGNTTPPTATATATTAATTAPTAMAGTAAPAQTAPASAGMLDGGPDYWRVTGIEGRLNIRADASIGANIVATAGEGDTLRNRGCKVVDARTWCQVETVAGGARTGWAVNQFLREGPAPGQAASQTTATSDAPRATPAVSAKRPVANPAIGAVPPRAAPAAPADASAPRTSSVVSATKPAPKPAQKDGVRGNLPCSTALGMPTRDCAFTVVRVGGGDAAVKISRPDGSTRSISFVKGAPAPVDGQRTERRGNLTVINIGNERYEIPDAVVFGG